MTLGKVSWGDGRKLGFEVLRCFNEVLIYILLRIFKLCEVNGVSTISIEKIYITPYFGYTRSEVHNVFTCTYVLFIRRFNQKISFSTSRFGITMGLRL